MSILGNPLLKKTAAAETDKPMLTPEQVIEQLRVLRQQIPEFVLLPNNRQTKAIRRQASVNVEFTHEAIGAVGVSELVKEAVGNTPADFYQAEDEVARWTIVEAEMRAMLQGVVAANTVRRHRIGLAALQAYNVSRQLVKSGEHAELLPHVETMSRIPKFTRRRVKAPAAEPAKPAQPVKSP